MDAETKERLIDEFRACLDDWEPGAAGEPTVDLALLFAELSVLRNEVRVEARQFKTALDEMRALTELLGEQNRRLVRDLELAREAEGVSQRQSERGLLLDLIDVRDRIAAALEVFRAYRPGWLSRFAAKEMQHTRGMGEGIELTLRRLDAVLAERRVSPIEAVGMRLDPHSMRAVGVAFDAQHALGVVLREARRGYRHHDELLRLAEVIVNKRENES